jgi:cell division protein FtsI/penicillin-binding protein 2
MCRQIVDKYQRAYQSPSVQALVFRVDSGEILAQAQATQVRDNLKEAAQSGDYDSLYTDFGMYGYGRNNLASDMVPASTFKILHGLAAIDVGHVDFTHKCDTQVGYLPEDNAWVTPKPIEDYGANSVGYSSHNNTSKGTTMSHAIYKSCNQYFAALADTHTHPDALVGLCRDKGLRFSGSDACSLKPAGTRGAASNGYGQELTMNVYQLANMLIATATNYQPYLEYWDVYLTPEVRLEQTASSYRPLFVEQEKVDNIGTHILSGMRTKASPLTKRLNKDSSKTPLRVYGKTGTGDHLISTRTYTTEKVGDYIVPQKRRGKQVWEENYEAPYGVKSTRRKGVLKGSNMSIYVALVEQASQEPDQVHGQRIGVVVRIPRVGQKPSNCRYGITASCIAEPVAEDLITTIREHGLIPE